MGGEGYVTWGGGAIIKYVDRGRPSPISRPVRISAQMLFFYFLYIYRERERERERSGTRTLQRGHPTHKHISVTKAINDHWPRDQLQQL